MEFNYNKYMSRELNNTVDTVLTTIKNAEHSKGQLQKQYYREDIHRIIYGYQKYIKAIYDCDPTIPYSDYSDYVEAGAAIEEEGISCIGHNIIYLNTV